MTLSIVFSFQSMRGRVSREKVSRWSRGALTLPTIDGIERDAHDISVVQRLSEGRGSGRLPAKTR